MASPEHWSKIAPRINKAGVKISLLRTRTVCAHHFGLLGFIERLMNCKVYLEEEPNMPGGILELGPLSGRSGEGGRGQEIEWYAIYVFSVLGT